MWVKNSYKIVDVGCRKKRYGNVNMMTFSIFVLDTLERTNVLGAAYDPLL